MSSVESSRLAKVLPCAKRFVKGDVCKLKPLGLEEVNVISICRFSSQRSLMVAARWDLMQLMFNRGGAQAIPHGCPGRRVWRYFDPDCRGGKLVGGAEHRVKTLCIGSRLMRHSLDCQSL